MMNLFTAARRYFFSSRHPSTSSGLMFSCITLWSVSLILELISEFTLLICLIL